MVKVSIIIPVYNAVSFLEDCVQSLLQQTFQNFEIWLINDGSTDGSDNLCNELAPKDNRIHVIHTPNYGAAHARKMGITHATGEWLFFVDSDDTIPKNALDRMIQPTMKNPETDIVVGYCRDRTKWGKTSLSPEKYRKLLIEGRYNIGSLWAKLFRANLFSKGIPDLPPNLVMGEDMLINIYLSFLTKNKIQLVKGKRVYNYIQRKSSICHHFKLTADYEYAYHHERLKMIPPAEHSTYMPTMIHRRLRMSRRLLREADKQNAVEDFARSAFIKELVHDIHATNYSFFKYPRPSLWKILRKTAFTKINS